jgi:hypothetical protein
MGLNIVVIMSLFMLPLSGWLCHSSKLTNKLFLIAAQCCIHAAQFYNAVSLAAEPHE